MKHCMINNDYVKLPTTSAYFDKNGSDELPEIILPNTNGFDVTAQNAVAPADFNADCPVRNSTSYNSDYSPSAFKKNHLPGFLITQLNKLVRIEFLLGTQTYTERTGILLDVGADFVILSEFGSSNKIVCDLQSIKFVSIFDSESGQMKF